jgi:LPXTG-motif cell wall-anchored protein
MPMRVLPPVGAAALAVAATVLLAPAASAHGAPGDNGTIKIHDSKTGEELVKNEPHVCTFYLDAFFFDGLQQADWKIVDQPPTGHDDTIASSGAITLDTAGNGRTGDLTLPKDGHYKLEWDFDGKTKNPRKYKVFWYDCKTGSTSGGTTGGSTTGGTTTGGTTGGGTDGGTSVSGGVSTGGSSSGGTTASPTSSVAAASTNGNSGNPSGGSLAETGASVIGISAAGAALLGVGGAFMLRRRGSRQH